MKRVADASEEPIVVPLVVVAVAVDVALVVPPVKRQIAVCMERHPYHCPSNILGTEFHA